MLRWYPGRTKPAGEHAAEVNLERQGYTVCLPFLAQPVRSNGQWRDRVSRLFLRYVLKVLGPEVGVRLAPECVADTCAA